MEPPSICSEFNEKQKEHYIEGLDPRSELFNDMGYYDDTCLGQRGFGRNVDRLCNSLINGYHTSWPVQAANTVRKIEEELEAEKERYRKEKKR